MKTLLIDLHYLPSLEFFAAIQPYQKIIIERYGNYQKQTYQNRCYILGANNTQRLVVPLKGKNYQTKITDVKIDYQQKWLNEHWRGIYSSYGKAPYFEHFSQDLEKVLFRKHIHLYDLNVELLTLCLKIIGFNIQLTESERYETNTTGDIMDLRNVITPKQNWQTRQLYRPYPYIQVFGSNFVENLSIVDLIFCEGNRAMRVIRASAITE